MVSVRVRRGGLSLVLGTEAGTTFIGLAAGQGKPPDIVNCSMVSLYSVLSGVECHAVAVGRECVIRLEGEHVELIWKRTSVETLFRLAIPEYRSILRSLSEGSRDAA